MNLRRLKRFFFGVIGWTPETLYHAASLEDLADAYEGYLESKGLSSGHPRISRRFMNDMMIKNPD